MYINQEDVVETSTLQILPSRFLKQTKQTEQTLNILLGIWIKNSE
jgi:hypothetical protein